MQYDQVSCGSQDNFRSEINLFFLLYLIEIFCIYLFIETCFALDGDILKCFINFYLIFQYSTSRWAQHHEDGIQQAFFNGGGFESWENIWGLWNGITERDGEAIRRTSAILRQFGDCRADDGRRDRERGESGVCAGCHHKNTKHFTTLNITLQKRTSQSANKDIPSKCASIYTKPSTV